MAYFKYKGRNTEGKRVSGTKESSDEKTLRVDLRNEGIILEQFSIVKAKRKSNFLAVSSKVSNTQFLCFCNQFAIMLKAGITIKDCLASFSKQSFSTYFKNIISDVYELVLKGVYLSDALRRYPKVFPSYFCSMVYVGELSGSLSDVLISAANYYSNDTKTKRKIKSALFYPCFLLIVVVVVFFLLMIMVVPSFVDMLESADVEIPTITKITIAMSDFIIGNLPFILIGLLALVGIGFLFFRSKTGKKVLTSVIVHLPILKKVEINSITTRFCSTLSILLKSGMQVVDCMEVMPTIIDNPYFTAQFKSVIVDINHGKKLSKSLEKVKVFPEMMIQMTVVGENSSALPEVYSTIGDYYNDELNASITRATSMLEPLVIVLMGVLVLFVLLAVMLPMFSMLDAI